MTRPVLTHRPLPPEALVRARQAAFDMRSIRAVAGAMPGLAIARIYDADIAAIVALEKGEPMDQTPMTETQRRAKFGRVRPMHPTWRERYRELSDHARATGDAGIFAGVGFIVLLFVCAAFLIVATSVPPQASDVPPTSSHNPAGAFEAGAGQGGEK